MIGIIDYDAGNIKSVEKSLNYLGEEAIITRDHDEIVNSDKVILPGVGAFADAMEKIRHYGLEETIHEVVEKNIPFLGICLGLQLLFEGSEESDGVEGLHLLDGEILRIPEKEGLKIPNIGWNSLDLQNNGRLFQNLEGSPFVYFVHSYFTDVPKEYIDVTADYGLQIPAMIHKDLVFGAQFHPERSGKAGARLIQNFLEL